MMGDEKIVANGLRIGVKETSVRRVRLDKRLVIPLKTKGAIMADAVVRGNAMIPVVLSQTILFLSKNLVQ